MAQLKLFFPSLSYGQGLFTSIVSHTALLSVALAQEQNQEKYVQKNKNIRKYQKISSSIKGLNLWGKSSLILKKERVRCLRFVMEEGNDYSEIKQKDSSFVHALELQCQIDWNEIQTINSESISTRDIKSQEFSDTNSVLADSEVVSIV